MFFNPKHGILALKSENFHRNEVQYKPFLVNERMISKFSGSKCQFQDQNNVKMPKFGTSKPGMAIRILSVASKVSQKGVALRVSEYSAP